MSDPQSVTANDVDTLRAIAARHADHPEITRHLYAAADYVAVLQRGQQLQRGEQWESGGSESIEVQPVVDGTCPMKWAVAVQSVAAGNDVKEETCGRPASEPVEYCGVSYVVCPGCKDELMSMGGRAVGKTA